MQHRGEVQLRNVCSALAATNSVKWIDGENISRDIEAVGDNALHVILPALWVREDFFVDLFEAVLQETYRTLSIQAVRDVDDIRDCVCGICDH